MRERLFSKKKYFGKQPIENKPHFYKSFPLTKDSFPLTNIFLHYQTLENVENYLSRRFSSETNKARMSNRACESIIDIGGWEWKQNTWVSWGLGSVSMSLRLRWRSRGGEIEIEKRRDWDWESLGSEAKERFWVSGHGLRSERGETESEKTREAERNWKGLGFLFV